MAKPDENPMATLNNGVNDAKLISLIAGAMSVVGPREKGESFADYSDAVREEAIRIYDISQSPAGNDIRAVLRTTRKFRATILDIKKDAVTPGKQPTERMVIVVRTKSNYGRTKGDMIEDEFRTERLDAWDGSGRRVASTALDLIGYDVMIYVEADGDEGQFRVVRHVAPLGKNEEYDKLRDESRALAARARSRD